MEILRARGDKIEPASIDEAYLDVSSAGTFEKAEKLARKIKDEIKKKERLTASIGVGPNKLIAKIKAIVNLEHIDRVVIGLPLNLKGEATLMTTEVQRFVEKLRNHTTVPVQTFDERLTSAMADRLLQENPSKHKKQDQVAAQIILQNYLDSVAV